MQSDACVIGWPLHKFMLHRTGIRNVPTSQHRIQLFIKGRNDDFESSGSRILDVLNVCVCAYCMFVRLVRLHPRQGVPLTSQRVSWLPHRCPGSICTCVLLPKATAVPRSRSMCNSLLSQVGAFVALPLSRLFASPIAFVSQAGAWVFSPW
jgi:hypothetical protein